MSDARPTVLVVVPTLGERPDTLAESLASVQEHSTPLEQATTTSLEALQAYSAGKIAMYASHKRAYAKIGEAPGGRQPILELPLQCLGADSILLALPTLQRCQVLERKLEALNRLLRPIFTIFGPGNLRCKGRVRTAAQQD